MSDKQYALDAYVLDTLMRDLVGHDRRTSAFLIYLSLLASAEGGFARISHAQLAERTGLSKRSTQDALLHLIGRGLLRAARSGVTEVTRYELLLPWRKPAC
jgi:CRP-like cAMP-binding protein